MALALPAMAGAAVPDKTTKYRVYQYDQAVTEFADYKQAVNFAQWYTNSRVEEIGTGSWKWDNYPRYQIYQLGATKPEWQFARLEDAVKEASNWTNASIRDLEGTGWVWNNYPRYQVYQGDITLDEWLFTSLNDATAEAKRWAGSHIIDLTDNRWVWDNLSAADKETLRAGGPAYQVYQSKYTQDSWRFAYLEDAVAEALNWGDSHVVRIGDKQTVFSNFKRYKVYQGDKLLDSFVSLDQAADYARLWAHSSVRQNGQIIWNNYATYTVYQSGNLIGEYFNLPDALYYAGHYANASIGRLDGKTLWNNFRKLQIWGWNGSATKETVAAQTASVMGLDVDSPSWFQLEDATGKLKDTSSKETADMLKKRGFHVHPLVSNQFDSVLTSAFLANKEAQSRFIAALVDKAALLQVEGLNIDFESLNGKDRAAFTAFIEALVAAAHEKNLKISVDLPRGSVKWNHLTAFDHEKLATAADYIVTMAYDQHYSASTVPGSVAGLQWIEEGIKEFLAYGIPRDKLILGIPFYVREWTIDAKGALAGTRAVYAKDVPSLIAERQAISTWDPTFNQYKVEYTGTDGNPRVFWLEDSATVKARLELAKKYELAGVAAWRLGQEDPEFWKTIVQNK
jgi:spore germination protein YaaH